MIDGTGIPADVFTRCITRLGEVWGAASMEDCIETVLRVAGWLELAAERDQLRESVSDYDRVLAVLGMQDTTDDPVVEVRRLVELEHFWKGGQEIEIGRQRAIIADLAAGLCDARGFIVYQIERTGIGDDEFFARIDTLLAKAEGK